MDLGNFVLTWTPWLLLALAVGAMARIVIGPRAADRLVALNVLAGLVLAFLVIRGIRQGRALYLDVALVYDIFGFLGFLAVAHFLRDKISEGGGGQ